MVSYREVVSLIHRHGLGAHGVEDAYDDELCDERDDMCQAMQHVLAHELVEILGVGHHGHAHVTELDDG